MAVPILTVEDVAILVPQASKIREPLRGGQKLVFPCIIEEKKCVVKFMMANPSVNTTDLEAATHDVFDEVTARAKREVETMQQCESPYIVKIGPIPLTKVDFHDQSLIFFSEEMIEGDDLRKTIKEKGPLPIKEVVMLGQHITEAIKVVWSFAKVHRDIKPSNIIKAANSGKYVLLDMGLAFDLMDISLTVTGIVVGTVPYFSPEQTEFTKKRQLDFRSDLFSLGIVLYEALTGKHPFLTRERMSTSEIVGNILSLPVEPPSRLRTNVPDELNNVILRLLAKHPHLRYRTCDSLLSSLSNINTSR